MTILPAGTFKVSDYRKPITDKVVREVMKRYRRDHRPPLVDRPYDTEAGDFIPPQLDPKHIDLIEIAVHDQRTFGRKVGAEKTVTTRGSDVGEAARARKIRHNKTLHNFKMACKTIGEMEALKMYPEIARHKRRKKHKLVSRGFDKGHRPLRSANNLVRRK